MSGHVQRRFGEHLFLASSYRRMASAACSAVPWVERSGAALGCNGSPQRLLARLRALSPRFGARLGALLGVMLGALLGDAVRTMMTSKA
jgi:hypothetical protein